jgi:hypothetical protein
MKKYRKASDKWLAICKGKDTDSGSNNCPLCKKHKKSYGCGDCPIALFAGVDFCFNTPYTSTFFTSLNEETFLVNLEMYSFLLGIDQ